MTSTKILHVIASLNPVFGGPMQGLRNYLPAIYKRGFQNEVVCLDDPKEPFIGKDSFITHAVGPSNNPWSYSARLVPWLQRNLQRFDVVIIHGLWQYHGFAVHRAVSHLKKQKSVHIPDVFVMAHGMLDPYFQKAPERKWKALRNIVYWKLVESKVINHANAVLFTCAEELRLAKQTFPSYKPKEEINIGYGIAEPPAFTKAMADAFAVHCPKVVKDQPFLLFISRIHPKKGIDLLIEAYAEIQSSSTDRATGGAARKVPFLIIAGPGLDTTYGQQMQKLVQQLGLTETVFFPGMLMGDAKWGAFYACDAFVLTSHQENFGIAVAEALACQKPVLISDQINIWREIKEAGGGFVAADTLSGAVSLLRQWMQLSDGERKACGLAARACYEKHFAVEIAAAQMLKAILKDKVVSKEVV